MKSGEGDRPQGPKVINVGSSGGKGKPVKSEEDSSKPKTVFHSELTKKLEEVQVQRQSLSQMGRKLSQVSRKSFQSDGRKSESGRKLPTGVRLVEGVTEVMDKPVQTRGILRRERRESQVRRREVKIIKRKEGRLKEGKHGLPVYDPLTVPDIEHQETSFHYLGVKLKRPLLAPTTKNALSKDDLKLFQSHPGFSTTDNVDVNKKKFEAQDQEAARSIVAFHPVVKYFNLNEKKKKQKHF